MSATQSGRRSAISKTSALLAGLLAAVSLAAASASAAVTAAIQASRTSGVAPLAVSFDATGTTSTATTRPFHDVYYSWTYGDAGSGTWATNGKSKNHDTGPLGGHVFETAGTYTVTLMVKDSTGATDTETVTINVSDPNTVFSGTNTICVSTSGNFTGAPTGAATVTTTSWATVVAQLGAGKRVLLRRGEVWDHDGVKKNITFSGGPGILGAFGPTTSGRPRLRLTSSNTTTGGRVFWLCDKVPNANLDFRFMDLEIDGNGQDRAFAWAEGSAHNVTFLRVYMHDGGPLLHLSPDIPVHYNGHTNTSYQGHTLSSGIAIVDTEFQRMVGDGGEFNGHHGAYLGLHRSLFLGNVWNNTELGEHVLRLPFVQRTLIAHNELTNARATKHLIKLHAYPGAASLLPVAGHGQSKFVTIADNYFTSHLGNWLISTGPQNNTSNEVVQDIILERNHVEFGSQSTTAFDLRGSDHTVRNNTIIMDGSPSGGTAVVIAQRGIEPAPTNNRVYNNSAYRGGTPNFTLVNIAPVASDTTVHNNLGSAPSSAATSTIVGGGTNLVASHNTITNTPGWVSSTPTTGAHFDLLSTSSAINAGTTVPVFDDFDEAPRPQGAAYDLGAFEFIPPTITIAATDASAAEPSGNGLFTVTASPAPSAPLTVNLSRSGSATNGSDYSTIASTVTIPTSGSVTIPVTVINDTAVESNETVTLAIASGTGYTIGSPSSATVTITSDDVANLISYGTFEPDQATVLADQTSPYTVGSGTLNKWQGRLGTGVQQTTYQTSGTNHYVTVGTSVNTNGCFQVIVWPGNTTRTLTYQYRGTSSFVRVYGGSSGDTLNKFDGGNTLTQITQINNASASTWTTKTQTITLSGSHGYLILQLRGGDFDNITLQ
jgi:hypothetical protein